MKAIIVFPHQLFAQGIGVDGEYWLVEESLFFRQYHFHPIKLAYHRATMKVYEQELIDLGKEVHYVEAHQQHAEADLLIKWLASKGVEELHLYDVVDDWLEQKITKAAKSAKITIQWHISPMFLESKQDVIDYCGGKKRLFHADFYKHQRLKHEILIDDEGLPVGGRWSFDEENRKKYPKGKKPPKCPSLSQSKVWKEGCAYVESHFDNPYDLPLGKTRYPITRQEAKDWLNDFLHHRLPEFGPFEDAIVQGEGILHHSVLTPMLNIGLLTPREVIDAAVQFADNFDVPMNSLEGFIRQILGWREYIRMVYEWKGRQERTRNFWSFKKKIPLDFWMGTTGILPLDETIRKVRETGYCHHIERLMVLGNYMLLSEFDPDEVYRWFMELFIDAYDWVMVPNVYGMSQFADGGLMATKPYISGSNYLMKMGNFPKGEWQEQWDLMFWRFIDNHRAFFESNPRLNMMVRTLDKLSPEKLRKIRSRKE